ncbi:MAG: hypothetical protein AB7E49_09040, partial [Campylobacterales bacterium]
RYVAVKARLEQYREAIETMTAELLKDEVIEGSRVKEIIREYEAAHGLLGLEDEPGADTAQEPKG